MNNYAKADVFKGLSPSIPLPHAHPVWKTSSSMGNETLKLSLIIAMIETTGGRYGEVN